MTRRIPSKEQFKHCPSLLRQSLFSFAWLDAIQLSLSFFPPPFNVTTIDAAAQHPLIFSGGWTSSWADGSVTFCISDWLSYNISYLNYTKTQNDRIGQPFRKVPPKWSFALVWNCSEVIPPSKFVWNIKRYDVHKDMLLQGYYLRHFLNWEPFDLDPTYNRERKALSSDFGTNWK